MPESAETIKRLLKSKVTFLVASIILIFVGFNLFQTWNKNQEISQEISQLQEQTITIEQSNLELRSLIEHFNSMAYIEEKARTDLGLKKEGEKIVIISETSPNPTGQKQASLSVKTQEQGSSLNNPEKWWQYFFKPEN